MALATRKRRATARPRKAGKQPRFLSKRFWQNLGVDLLATPVVAPCGHRTYLVKNGRCWHCEMAEATK